MKTNNKIELLSEAMEVKKRDDGTEFTCFSDTAPRELQDLFLKHYEVRDLDYQIFSTAIDTIVEAWNNNEDSPTLLEEYIQENYNDFASIWNAERISYLNIWNDHAISDILKMQSCETVSEACAYWYGEQVQGAINTILNSYLLKNE